MLRSYIRWRERQLERSRPRTVSPRFSWGLEYLQGADPNAADREAELTRFSNEMLANSDRFYRPPPACSFHLERDILTYPSAIRTGDVANDLVHARLHRASTERAVVLLPHWGGQEEAYRPFARAMRRVGITVLQLVPPYHDFRSVPGDDHADGMLSANLGRTIRSTRQAVIDTRLALDWLESQGYRQLGIVGVSLGSCIAQIVAAHDERVRALATLLTGTEMAECIWTGRATAHIRGELEVAGIDRQALRRLLAVCGPLPYVPKLANRGLEMLILTGTLDEVGRPAFVRRLVVSLRKHGVDPRWRQFHCGHQTLGTFPFNLMALESVLRFLLRSLPSAWERPRLPDGNNVLPKDLLLPGRPALG